MTSLQQNLKLGETENLTFIERTELKYEIAESMVAFSNTKGGVVYIGVNKKGKIIGVNPLVDLEIVELIASEICSPKINYVSKTIQDDYKVIIEIKIPEDKTKLYKMVDSNSKRNSYTRFNKKNVVMSKLNELVYQMNIKRSPIPDVFNQLELNLIEYITNNKGCSLNKIHKFIDFSITEIDYSLAQLIVWNKISIDFNGEINTFSVA
jgi:ATP-dependent DNA helicase RecG